MKTVFVLGEKVSSYSLCFLGQDIFVALRIVLIGNEYILLWACLCLL